MHSYVAEATRRDWAETPPSDHPLNAARPAIAKHLFEVLKQHEVSRSRLAEMLGINEKTVRQWLDTSKPLPFAVVFAMPFDMAADLVRRSIDTRVSASGIRGTLAVLKSALGAIDPAHIPIGERRELLCALVDANARINDLIRWLAVEEPSR